MTRLLFPTLAVVSTLLLATGSFAGLVGRAGRASRAVEVASVASTLAVHASTFAYLRATARRVEAIARRDGRPEWVGALAEKNRRKALPFQVAGSVLALAGLDPLVAEPWRDVVVGSIVAFQAGAFANEVLMVANQSRLLGGLSGPGPTKG